MFRSKINIISVFKFSKYSSLFDAQVLGRNLPLLCKYVSTAPVLKTRLGKHLYVNNFNFKRFHSSPVTSTSKLESENTSTVWEDINNLDINEVTGGDPALEKKLKILFLEREILNQEGFKVPRKVTADQWKELLQLSSRNKRKSFLRFLFSLEMKKENKKKKKEEKQTARSKEEVEEPNSEDRIKYGFHGSTIFVRVYDTTMNNLYNYNAIRAMIFGQKLVFDCSYDPYMNSRESKNCAKQLMIVFSENRIHPDPFNLYFTNAHADSPTMKYLHKHIPTLYEDTFPLNVTPKSYLDLFPKKDLVYLTPHCRESLKEYSHDDVYIVGAMVDKVNNEHLSLAKAKREGLRMAKLPLDHYLEWGSGSGKTLTLNQMLNILLDQKTYGDWRKAFKHVPQRKLIRDRTSGRSNIEIKDFQVSRLYT